MKRWLWLFAALACLPATLAGQAPSAVYTPPRTPDGHPDIQGVWQVVNTAAWNIQDHNAELGVPAGRGVVVGNDLPYRAEALEKRKQNFAGRATLDPETKCWLSGVPRITYMPYPFQIVQGGAASDMLMTYEFASASRIVRMNTTVESPVDTWMGWSRGRWDGDTLVVDVTAFNGESWFDRAGNYQTTSLHVVERYTPVARDVLQYEATIDDAQIYTRPWKISMPLYRRLEKNAQLVEYKCVEFAEQVMYGHLVKGR
jgi:hypothetical protein